MAPGAPAFADVRSSQHDAARAHRERLAAGAARRGSRRRPLAPAGIDHAHAPRPGRGLERRRAQRRRHRRGGVLAAQLIARDVTLRADGLDVRCGSAAAGDASLAASRRRRAAAPWRRTRGAPALRAALIGVGARAPARRRRSPSAPARAFDAHRGGALPAATSRPHRHRRARCRGRTTRPRAAG